MPEGDYEVPLGVARVAREGSDITLVGWGQQVGVLERAVRAPAPLGFKHIVAALGRGLQAIVLQSAAQSLYPARVECTQRLPWVVGASALESAVHASTPSARAWRRGCNQGVRC